MNIESHKYICSDPGTMNFLLSSILKYDGRVEIIAPTGSGKSKFIDEFFAPKCKGVVIVPFKIISNVYHNCKIIDKDSTEDDIASDKPLVMVVDQAVRFWNIIKNRTLIIDEAHCLITETTYRDAVIKFVANIRNMKTPPRTIAFTATPCGEASLLGLHQVHLTKDRDSVKTKLIQTNRLVDAMVERCVKAIDELGVNRVVIIDNTYADMIYHKLCSCKLSGYIDYMRSDTVDSIECKRVVNEESLHNLITISTKIACNGLNFNNLNEQVVILTSFLPGRNSYIDYIQMLGRFRQKCDISFEIFWSAESKYDYSVSNCIAGKSTDKDTVLFKHEYDAFLKAHSSSIHNIEKDMKEYKYIDITSETIICDKKYKCARSNNARDFKNWLMTTPGWMYKLNDIVISEPSWKRYVSMIKALVFRSSEFKVTRDIEALCKASRSDMDVILCRCKLFYDIMSMSDDDFSRLMASMNKKEGSINREMAAYDTGNTNKKLKLGRLKQQNKDNMKIAMRYRSLMKDGMELSDVLVLDKKIVCRAAGKKSSPKKAVVIRRVSDDEAIEFDSKGECASFLGISLGLFTKWIRGGKVKSKKLKDYEFLRVK